MSLDFCCDFQMVGSDFGYNYGVGDIFLAHFGPISTISDWFLEHDNEFTLLKWPPQSPDLNPIKHLWDVVERETNLQKLRDAIMSIWTTKN